MLVASCGGDGTSGSPTSTTFAVGGTVSGLSGTGLTLRNGADTLSVAANGSFVLPAQLASGASYSITIGTQPSAPSQTCGVQNGAGVVGNADVLTIIVVCTTSASTFAYAAVPHTAADAGVGRLEYFAFDAATGRQSLQGGLSAAADTYVFYVKARPSGHQLLVSMSTLLDQVQNISRADLTLYDLSTTTGAPTPSRLIASPGGGDLIFHPNGSDLYAPGSTVSHFSLAPGAAQGQSLGINVQAGFTSAITPDGKFPFVPNTGQGSDAVPSIAVISLADPQRPQLSSKVATPIRPLSTTLSLDGKLLYVAPVDAKDLGCVYRVAALGGLTPAGTFATPGYARSGVITPSGNFLYLASSDDNKVQGYRLDGTGGITASGSGTAVPSAFRLALSPGGQYL